MNPIRKTAGHLGRTSVGLAVLAILVIAGSVGHAAEGVAKVHAVRGWKAQFSTNGLVWKDLKASILLSQGTWVRTRRWTSVDLFLKQNGPVVRVGPATALRLTVLSFEPAQDRYFSNTELELTQGTILGSVENPTGRSKYSIRTPHGSYSLLSGGRYQLFSSGRLLAGEPLKVTYTATGKTGSDTLAIPAANAFDPSANGGAGGIVNTTRKEKRGLNQERCGCIIHVPPQMDVPTRGEGLGVDPAKVGFNGPFPKAPAK